MKVFNALLAAILMSALVAGAAVAGQEERNEQQEFADRYSTDGD